MPKPQPPKSQQPPVAGGPIHAVKCPACGALNDFRELLIAGGETTVYRGAEISCDACRMISVVTRVQPVTFISWRPTGKRAPAPETTGMVRR